MARIPRVIAERSLDTAPQTMPRYRAATGAAAATAAIGNSLLNAGADMMAREQRARENLEDFVADQEFQKHAARLDGRLDEERRKAPPGAMGLTEGFVPVIEDENRKWLNESGRVPERLKPKYEARAGLLTERLRNRAADVEYADRTTFFRDAVTARAGELGVMVAGDPDTFTGAREKLFADIDKTNLPAAEKNALKSRHGFVLAGATVDGLIKSQRYDEARSLAATFAGYGKGTAVAMTDEKRAARDEITRVATEAGVDANSVVAFAILESGLDPNAKNPNSTAAGLFQFREKERKRFGLEPGAPPEQQARVAVEWLREKGAELDRAGIPITPATLYLAHYQGTAGAKAILANPDKKLSDVLDHVGEGAGHGARVIEANKLDPNITAGQFAGQVTNKVNAAMIAAGATDLGFTERAAMVDRTETAIRADEYRRQHADREETRKVKDLVENDIASIRATGKEIGELSEAQVSDRLGADTARQWVIKREQARRYFESTKDFDVLPGLDISARVTQLADDAKKAAGTAGYVGAQELYETARKKGDAILKLREDDPARAVEQDPDVGTALSALDMGKPSTVQALVGARMAAQKRIGIPPNSLMPVTNREAREIAGTLDAALPSERVKTMRRVVTEIQMLYGDWADEVFTAVAGQFIKDRETRELAGGVLKKMGLGQPVTPADARKLDVGEDAERTRRALAGQQPGSGAPGPDPNKQPAEKRDPSSVAEVEKHRLSFKPAKPIDRESFRRIVANPETAAAFDEEFGAGAAQWVLKGVELVTQQGGKKPGAEKKPATEGAGG
jgi:hypothetical protein